MRQTRWRFKPTELRPFRLTERLGWIGHASPLLSSTEGSQEESGVSPVGEGLKLLLRQGYEAVIASLARQVTRRHEILLRCLSLT